MHLARVVGAGVVVLLLARAATAQQVLYTATVKDNMAEVRCKPSTDPKAYATNMLPVGTVVEVVEEMADSWLKIKVPPHSKSWINMRFLKQLGPYAWVVVAHADGPVPVRVGSNVVNEKPTVEGVKLTRGSIVVAVGREIVTDDGSWLPIEPPPGEVRFIRAQSVSRGGVPEATPSAPPTAVTAAASPALAVPSGAGAGFAPVGGSASPLPPAAPSVPNPLWSQAQELERAGKLAEAEKVYGDLARQVYDSNHDLAMQCHNRIHFLREAQQNAAARLAPAPQPTDTRYGGGTGQRLQPVAAGLGGAASCYVNTCYPQAACSGTTTAAYSGQAPAPGGAERQSPPGRLRLAGRGVDSRRTYVLEDSQGRLVMYVTAQPGVDLESYLNCNVELAGSLVYRMDLRAQYMVASRVRPLQ